ncbi:MAG: hypothetical protein JW974_03075 [Alphaproteobacteria bacterium]|nr:hypothetical protein [Alphaproteobacteria bacterium]MBN2674921.1 hypothetical protein [Alphaproteobacteria bacterium]
MYIKDIDKKVQDFFDSVIETLEISKLYTFEISELQKIDININAVKNMKRPFYFRETPFYLLGLSMTEIGFNKFNKNISLFDVFNKALTAAFIHYTKKETNSIEDLKLALQVWDNLKPKNNFKNLIRTVIPKKMFASKQLVH